MAMALSLSSGVCSVNHNYVGQYPNNSQVSGYVCLEDPANGYPRFSQCCDSEVHNVTSPTNPEDISYPATCVAWCYVKPERTVTNGSAENPYGFSDFYLCLTDHGYQPDKYGSTCGWVNDPEGQASSSKYLTGTQWSGFTTWNGQWPLPRSSTTTTESSASLSSAPTPTITASNSELPNTSDNQSASGDRSGSSTPQTTAHSTSLAASSLTTASTPSTTKPSGSNIIRIPALLTVALIFTIFTVL